MRRPLLLLTLVALLAAACGGDEASDPPGGASPDDTTSTDTQSADATTPDEPSGEPETTGDPDTSVNGEPASISDPLFQPNCPGDGDLSDSATGVTATTIKLGIAQSDWAELANLGLAQVNRGERGEVAEALLAELNENGGICGRTVEFVQAYNLPFGTETALASCLELTQDEQVFAVIGGYGGQGTQAANLCVTEAQDTALVGANFTQSERDQATAPWVTTDLGTDRRAATLVAAIEAEGLLDQFANVAVHSDIDSQATVDETLVPALEAAGVNVVERTVLDVPPGDVQAGIPAWRTFLELYRSKQVDAVFLEGDVAFAFEQLVQSGLDVTVFASNQSALSSAFDQSSDRNALTGISLESPFEHENRNDRMDECWNVFTRRTGIEIVGPSDLPDDEINWYTPVSVMCRNLDLFVQLAAAAGPELTNETLQAAIDGFGPIELPNQAFASFGDGKYDAQDGVVLTQFDPSAGIEGDFVPISDIIDTATG